MRGAHGVARPIFCEKESFLEPADAAFVCLLHEQKLV
jgi:hypothetical protein